jgi:FG-GAP-like repeat
MKRRRNFLCLLALLALGTFQFAEIGIQIISANNTPQTLPFSQDWSNTNLITTDDDWSNVPGIIGYRGDDLITATGVDPRTVLADGSGTPVDVIANQANPNTVTSGGVAEFEITNPTVALQGSGTADAPHIVIHLNTTGRSNIKFVANIRDIDGSGDDAMQQVDVQYRVGNTGNYTSVPGGYIADATTGPNLATLVTPLNLTLPANANNQALVQIRVITTNAVGNDEWVGVDDISVTGDATGGGTPTPMPTPRDANVDFNGDGKSDWVVTRGDPTGNASQMTWFISHNGANNLVVTPFGLTTDVRVPEDYDGDGKDDIAVWRENSPGSNRAYFFILQSMTNTLRIEQFGQTGDDPRVVADYDGDNKADLAVYRRAANGQNFFFYRSSLANNNFTSVAFGTGTNTRPNVGDYDGDGKADFCVHVNGQFILLINGTNTVEYINWGQSTDQLVPGDFDGDGKSDFAVVRNDFSVSLVEGPKVWYILERDGGGTGANGIRWGRFHDVANLADRVAPGDYDGDGRQDIAVWRPNVDPAMNFFLVRRSSDGALLTYEWGQLNDEPAANWYVH